MHASRIQLIAGLLLFCGAAIANAADDSAIGYKPGEGGLQLKLQAALIPIPFNNKDLVPLFIDADDLQGHQDREIEASGSARLRRRGQSLHADWLRYDMPEDKVHARGNAVLEQRGDVLEGIEMEMVLGTERGVVEKPKYQVQVNTTRGHGEGEKLFMEGEGKYRLLNGNYTSCDVGENDWFVRAKEFDIDKERQIGTARNARIEFFGTPILYTPYMNFSLDRQRKSGFLSPTFGSTSNSGFETSVPYYWNIAPNRDATITPRVMAKRGEQLSTEFRYLDARDSGELRYEIIPRDRAKNDDSRYALNYRHLQRWDNGFSGSLDIQKVSDDTYFRDLTTQVGLTSQSVLPRTATLSKGGSWLTNGTWGASAVVQRWQTLQADPLNPLTPPYNRSQFNFGAAKQNVGLTDLGFASSADDFSHPSLPNARRYVAYPTVTMPLQNSYAYATPKVGLHATRYNMDSRTSTLPDQARTVPITSLDSGLNFERNASMFNQNLTQTLEPKLYYVYIPTRSQNQLPVFDSGLQDINFATLYTENQFSGQDRINDANQVTMGVNSRFLNQDSGVERLRVGVAQRYYFKNQEVTLPNVAPRGTSNSDLLAAVSGTIAQNWTTDAGWQYSTDSSQTQRFNGSVRFLPEPGKVVNLAYRFTHTTPTVIGIRQVDLSTQWAITGRMSGVARWNYSIQDNRMVEGIAGIEYDGGCWAFRVVGRAFTTSATTQVTSIFMQLELNGLSKIGSNPLSILRSNIGGYYRSEPPATQTDYPFPVR